VFRHHLLTDTRRLDPAPDSPEKVVEKTRYSVAYVKRDGKWLRDSIHDEAIPEVAHEPTPGERLKELEWLVGEWVAENDEAEVRMSCVWAESQSSR
jgi:hypothetical protein